MATAPKNGPHTKPPPPNFERSRQDTEPKGMREGTRREETYDRTQQPKGK